MKKSSPILSRFVEKSPISVIARGMIERLLNPAQLDRWFAKISKTQYTRNLLFSTIFDIMSQVVLGSSKSVNAAYMAGKDEINVSITSVYNKLNGIEIRRQNWSALQQKKLCQLSKRWDLENRYCPAFELKFWMVTALKQ